MRKKKKNKFLWKRIFFCIFLLIILIWVFALIIGNIFSKDTDKKPSTSSSASSKSDNTTNANYEYIETDSTLINQGNLILVNSDHAYTAPIPTTDNLTNLVDYRQGLTSKNFSVIDKSVNLSTLIINDFNNMMTDFAVNTKVTKLIVTSGLRTKEYQQTLYNKDLKNNNSTVSTLVALPGHSEHHTGYALDFSYNDAFKNNCKWLNENSYKYGFIQRYSEDKKGLTKIDNQPWHYRYVGQPHAYYMKQNNLCFEEYINLIKKYTFAKEHLKIKNFDDVEYEVYYVPATKDKTKIPAPKECDSYVISGNNVDGFIVTVLASQNKQ